jgi:archaellum component FlaC
MIIALMSEQNTHNLNGRSFEERVMARFDAIDGRLERLEARSYDTKPIWERALGEITEVRERGLRTEELVTEVRERGLRTEELVTEVRERGLRTEELVTEVRERVQRVEGFVTDLASVVGIVASGLTYLKERAEDLDQKFDVVTQDLMQMRGDQRRLRHRMDHLESK